ncbi:MAG: FAD-binding protein [Desulfurococcales archaeon]|nr:FAD-binding protein [Desulfurococcales archaeon]
MAGDKLVKGIVSTIGKEKVVTDPSIIKLYSREPSGYTARELPLAVVFPETVNDVSKLVSYAYKNDVKIYPQGSTTSLAGSAVPLNGGVVLSMERMDSVVETSVPDSYTIAEAGVRIDELNNYLASYGYMFPVDPASSAVATVGGAVNSGAGGMRGAKYGTMKDWVLGLQIVLPDERGTQMWIGCRTLKCRQGYDLTRLIIGSEGTLAIVTRSILKITPLPESVVTALAFFPTLEQLSQTAVDIKNSGIQPYIMEFLDEKTTQAAMELADTSIKGSGAMLLVSIDVNREATRRMLSWLVKVLENNSATAVYTAETIEEAEGKGLFDVRRSLFPAQNYLSRKILGIGNPMIYIEDIAVPPSKLVDAVREIARLEEKYGLPTFMGGHISDGNLHPAVGFDPGNRDMASKVEEWFYDLMRIAISLGGTISSEHGIGLMKKKGLEMELEAHGAGMMIGIMKKIKLAFDPKNILNPGKVV